MTAPATASASASVSVSASESNEEFHAKTQRRRDGSTVAAASASASASDSDSASDVRSPSLQEGLGEGLPGPRDPLPPPLPGGGGPSPSCAAGSSARADSDSARERALFALLGELDSVLVCFSGGVDSSALLAAARRALGPRALAFTAVSPSLDPDEAAAARAIARALGVEHVMVETHELDDARYASNPLDRCYVCKREVYGVATRVAAARGIATVIDGFNVDDRADHRPGRKAARELGVRSPLDEVGMDKAAVRALARALGLRVWDKPALACLASRFPYGTPITPARLLRVARAEKALRALGFRVVRVRSHGERARVELGPDELGRVADPRLEARVLDAVRAAGFEGAEIDPRGYRRGALNE